MNDAQIVEQPKLWPAWCVGCQSQKGPQLDLGVDLPAPGPDGVQHLYICRTCGRVVAKAFGFAPGEKLQQLENAAEALVEAEKIVEQYDTKLSKMAEALGEEQRRSSALEAEVEQLRNEKTQQRFLVEKLVSDANQLAVTG